MRAVQNCLGGVRLRLSQLSQQRTALQWLFVLLLSLASVVTASWRPVTPTLAPGDISPEDYMAPRTIVFTDDARTAQLQEQAAQKVPDVYDPDLAAAVRAESRLRAFYAQITAWLAAERAAAAAEEAAARSAALRTAVVSGNAQLDPDAPGAASAAGSGAGGVAPSGTVADARDDAGPGTGTGTGSGTGTVTGNGAGTGSGTDPIPPGGTVSPPLPPLPDGVTPEGARALQAAGLLDPHTQDFAIGLLLRVMAQDIRPDGVAAARQQLTALLAAEIPAGEQLAPYIEGFVEPTLLPNPTETAARRAAAASAIQPVRETIKQGQVIARRGSVLTSEQIAHLQALGLLEPPVASRAVRIAVTFLLVLTFGVVWLRLRAVQSLREQLCGLLLAWFGLALIVAAERSALPLPVALPLLLSAGIWGGHPTRLLGVFLLGVALVVSPQTPLVVMLAVLFGATLLVPVWLQPYRLNRRAMLATGLILGGWAAVALTFAPDEQTLWHGALTVLVHGLTGVLALGFMAVWEWLTGCTSTLRLQELSQLDQPLLQRLFAEAPGTWQHALAVGHLAEIAAQAIGANPILARVGGYYHDVGKLVAAQGTADLPSPCFFTENQAAMLGKDQVGPHDLLTPRQSAAIIRRHVDAGVRLLQEAHFPAAVVAIVQSHHGTSLVEYFYCKALTEQQERERQVRREIAPPEAAQPEAALAEPEQAEAAQPEGALAEPSAAPVEAAVVADMAISTAGSADEADADSEAMLPVVTTGDAPATAVAESDFRYAGPVPISREAAIVMLADTVEACSRSMVGSSRTELHARIRALIQAKLADGQLDQCLLTGRDLAVIAEVLTLALKGAAHERIPYPSRPVSRQAARR